MLRSTFKFQVFLIPVLLVFFTAAITLIVTATLKHQMQYNFSTVASFVLFCFAWIWLLFGELRTKAIVLTLFSNEIIVSRFLGLGKRKSYQLADFELSQTAYLSSRYKSYEYLYFLQGGKRRFALSEFYHKNYPELKASISLRLPNPGERNVSLLEQFKDIFRR